MNSTFGGYLNLNESFNEIFGSDLVNLNESFFFPKKLNSSEKKVYAKFQALLAKYDFNQSLFDIFFNKQEITEKLKTNKVADFFRHVNMKKEYKGFITSYENLYRNRYEMIEQQGKKESYDYTYIISLFILDLKEYCKNWIKFLKLENINLQKELPKLMNALLESGCTSNEMKKWS